jgi:hypothetical protein
MLKSLQTHCDPRFHKGACALYTADDWERKVGTWGSTVHEKALFLGNAAQREPGFFASTMNNVSVKSR